MQTIVPALLSNRSQLLRTHMTVGASTGYMESLRGSWPAGRRGGVGIKRRG